MVNVRWKGAPSYTKSQVACSSSGSLFAACGGTSKFDRWRLVAARGAGSDARLARTAMEEGRTTVRVSQKKGPAGRNAGRELSERKAVGCSIKREMDISSAVASIAVVGEKSDRDSRQS